MPTIYIATTGNDTTGNGTEGSPYLTKQKAHDVASSGDTIQCAAGTYAAETFTITKTITVQGATGYTGEPTTIFNGAADYVNITGDGITVIFNDCKMTSQSQLSHSDAGWCHVTNTTVLNTLNLVRCVFRGQIIEMDGAGRGGIVHMGNPGGGNAGITVNFTNCLFDSQVVNTNNSTDGFLVSAGANSGTLTLTFTGCTWYFATGTVPTNLIKAPFMGMTITSKNSIWNNASGTNIAWKGGETATSSYSCFYTNWTDLPTLGTGDIQVDPLFISPSTQNFNLRPTSPCIDTGVLI